jgi:hypothetical protein
MAWRGCRSDKVVLEILYVNKGLRIKFVINLDLRLNTVQSLAV